MIKEALVHPTRGGGVLIQIHLLHKAKVRGGDRLCMPADVHGGEANVECDRPKPAEEVHLLKIHKPAANHDTDRNHIHEIKEWHPDSAHRSLSEPLCPRGWLHWLLYPPVHYSSLGHDKIQ